MSTPVPFVIGWLTSPHTHTHAHCQVHNAHDLSRVMELGSKNRSVGATLMNVDSSRSHSIFTIDIEMVKEGGEGGIRAGRLNLVDLAGSERQSKTGSTGDRLKEATKINLSLSALGNVISGEMYSYLQCGRFFIPHVMHVYTCFNER